MDDSTHALIRAWAAELMPDSGRSSRNLAEYVNLPTYSSQAWANLCGTKNKSHQARLRLVVSNEPRESDGGYKSGRSSCLGTPDIFSTKSTRSGGTPLARHLDTAWCEIPHLEANFSSPPPFSIASSTTLMPRSLQPIVGVSQQPIRAGSPDSMQLMVVRTKEEARLEFAKNLNRELDRLEAPRRGRPVWLRDKLNKAVSRESCRKWLAGKDFPDEANMSILIDTLGLNHQLLRTGRWEPAPSSKDERFVELEKAWPTLDDNARNAILGVLRAMQPQAATSTPSKRRRA